MVVADFDAIDVLWIALSIFLILVGVALAIMFLRLAGTARRLTSSLGGVEDRALPLISEVGGTVERVNVQLDKADVVTTSAVDAVSAVDRGVRGVAGAVAWPVRKISSFTKGVKHGAASLRTERDARRAYDAGREAAERSDADFTDEMAETDKAEASPDASSEATGDAGASLESTEPDTSWTDTEQADAIARARSAGRRKAQSEAGERSSAPEGPPPGQSDG